MAILVLGASGATGKLLVEQLLERGQQVKVVVRPFSKIPASWDNGSGVTIIKADISEISREEMASHLRDCEGVASCLGHNLTLAGIFGKPRALVAAAVRLVCAAIKDNAPERPVRFVLMNTVGNSNRDLDEPVSVGQKVVIALLRLFLPPQADNEKAADFLRVKVGQTNHQVEWVVVRPDSLIDHDSVTAYKLYDSPIRSAIFDPGKTSRINVAHFMASLLAENDVWDRWKGKMPVIYNQED